MIINLSFENGSIANIIYTADGSNALQKEYIEVFGGGRSAVINDFKEVILYQSENKKIKKMATQDKGQKNMLDAWIKGLQSGIPSIPYDCLMANSLATILAVESLALGVVLDVDFNILNESK